MTAPGPGPREDAEAPSFRELLDDLAGRPDEGTRVARLRIRAVAAAERATSWGPMGPVAEVGWRVSRRDREMAGSVLASAIAYRLFIWALPLALVLVSGLGLVATSDGDAAEAIEDAGLGGVIADSIGDAADETSLVTRLLLIGGGLIVLLYETYVLLRATRAASAFAWRIPVRPVRAPVRQTLVLLGLLLGTFAAGTVTRSLAGVTDVPIGWLAAAAVLCVWPLAFLAMSVLTLPHAARNWTAHIPGALALSVCTLGIHLFNLLILFPWIVRKQETYGVLGLAAGVLFSLFILSRAFTTSIALNAVLHEGRPGAARSPHG